MQNLPEFSVLQVGHTQVLFCAAGCGLGVQHSLQNLPVFMLPHEHVQALALEFSVLAAVVL